MKCNTMLPVPINTKTIQRSPVEVSKDRNDKHKKVISIYFLSVLIIGLPGLRKHVKLYVTQLLLKPNKSVQFNTTWALTHICVQRTFGNLQNNSLMNPGRIFTRTVPCNLSRDMKTQSVSRQKYNKRNCSFVSSSQKAQVSFQEL